MDILVSQAQGLFTQNLIALYKELPRPTAFLRSFFTASESGTKFVSIMVQRGSESIAVDVLRGTQGRRNTMDRSSQKVFQPPYYREYFDATDLDFYDRLFGQVGGEVNERTFAEWINEVAEKLQLLQDKIERSIEKQCADVFLTGIITLTSGDNIDFKRKAASLVDLGAAAYWDQGTSDPIVDLTAAGNFLREEGKSMDGTYDIIMGGPTLNAFLDNTVIKERADIRNYHLDNILTPQRNAVGATFHGEVSAGSFRFRIWGYPQVFETTPFGAKTRYIDDNKAVVVPPNPNFRLAYAGVPHIIRDVRNAEFPEYISTSPGQFHVGNYVDQRSEVHIFDIKSAPVAIPLAVDQIYTMQTLT